MTTRSFFRLSDISRENVDFYTTYRAYCILFCLNIVVLHGKYQRTIFYQYEDGQKLASVAFRGSDVKKGITKFYERVPAEYAHTIAKSLLADAPKDVDQSEMPKREEFATGEKLNFDEFKE